MTVIKAHGVPKAQKPCAFARFAQKMKKMTKKIVIIATL